MYWQLICQVMQKKHAWTKWLNFKMILQIKFLIIVKMLVILLLIFKMVLQYFYLHT